MRSEEKRLVDVKEEVKSEDNKLKQVVKHFVKSLFILFFSAEEADGGEDGREGEVGEAGGGDLDHIHHHHSLRQSSPFKFSQTKDYQHLFFSR